MRGRLGWPGVLLGIGLVSGLVVGASVGVAAGASSAPRLSACVQANGLLRYAPEGACRSGEKLLTWYAQSPAGPPDLRWVADPWQKPADYCPDPYGWFHWGSEQTIWHCIKGGIGGTVDEVPPITNAYLAAMLAAAYPVKSHAVCQRDFPRLIWYGSSATATDPGECRAHQ